MTAARDLAPGQTIIRCSFTLDGPALVTSVEPSSLHGSPTVIVHGTVNGEDREWTFYANEELELVPAATFDDVMADFVRDARRNPRSGR